MPSIPIYTSRGPIAGPANQANATAAGMGGTVGAALERAGGTVTDVGDVFAQRAVQQEISKINAAVTQTSADLTNELTTDLKSADPNDGNFAANFSKKVQDKFAQIGDMATTRGGKEYFQRTAAQAQAHFQTRAFDGQTELAGAAAKSNYMDSLNSASSALVTSPSQLGFFIQHQDETLDAMVKAGSLSSTDAIALRSHSHGEAAKSAVLGWANMDPTAAKSMIERGDFDKYVDGTEKAQLLAHADQQIKAREVDARLAEEEARRAKKDAADSTMGQWLGQLAGKDPQNKLSAQDVLSDQNTDHQDKEHFLRLMGVLGDNGDRKTDPQTMADALHRAYLPPDDPGHLTEEEVMQGAGGTYRNPSDINALFSAIQGRKTTEGRQENAGFASLEAFAKKNLGGSSLGIPDPAGDALTADFMFRARDQYDAQRKAGKTMEQLLSPTSPDFIGRYLQVPTAKERSMRYVSAFKGGTMNLQTAPTLKENLPAYTPEQAAGLTPGTRFKGTDGVTYTKH